MVININVKDQLKLPEDEDLKELDNEHMNYSVTLTPSTHYDIDKFACKDGEVDNFHVWCSFNPRKYAKQCLGN